MTGRYHGHHLLLEHWFPLLDGAHMTSHPAARILSNRPLMPFTVMVAKFLSHTDAHLGLGLVLVLVLNLSCPVPAVGDAVVTSFARAHPCGWVCPFISSARDHSPAVGPLFFYPLWVRSFHLGCCLRWCCCGLLDVLV